MQGAASSAGGDAAVRARSHSPRRPPLAGKAAQSAGRHHSSRRLPATRTTHSALQPLRTHPSPWTGCYSPRGVVNGTRKFFWGAYQVFSLHYILKDSTHSSILKWRTGQQPESPSGKAVYKTCAFHTSLPGSSGDPSIIRSPCCGTVLFYKPHSPRNTCTPKAHLPLSTRALALSEKEAVDPFSPLTSFTTNDFSSVSNNNNGPPPRMSRLHSPRPTVHFSALYSSLSSSQDPEPTSHQGGKLKC